ncbi:Coiled-coil domain-containing protein R3HCC1L [Zancudomyces culisetae]|uniref:Coiled-coil domain-containing protein R3HCC1L n=1 Tax=Zancudomyces culisetae TaxID=1213189 RepID=A0A1R1PRC0_ZANCU|nr:Coiled-coil domain-containing protein R3HCC1L [Zancudomyces culisetae]|eukprot:OMH83489.1 Coiled-coil domain-containing protein R3HCC1L [Zancudomyces culisetae]
MSQDRNYEVNNAFESGHSNKKRRLEKVWCHNDFYSSSKGDTVLKEDSSPEKTLLKRIRSLSMSKVRAMWTEDSIHERKTVDLYNFPKEYETSDINDALYAFQQDKCVNGGYRIKWLTDTRALVTFKSPIIAQEALDTLGGSCEIQSCLYAFKHSDLEHFNRRSDDKKHKNSVSDDNLKVLSSYIESVRKVYKPSTSIELYDFSRAMETSELLLLLSPYRVAGNTIRIKWFNKNQAIALFSSAEQVPKALDELSNISIMKARAYVFMPADVKYFTQDIQMTPLDSINLRHKSGLGQNPPRNATISRRNTVSYSSRAAPISKRNTISLYNPDEIPNFTSTFR